VWLMSRACAVLAFIVFYSSPAPAQSICSPRDDAIAQLGRKYGEVPRAIGLADGGHVVEVLTSDRGGTWTIIVTLPNGVSCLVAAGENWENLPPPPPPDAARDIEG